MILHDVLYDNPRRVESIFCEKSWYLDHSEQVVSMIYRGTLNRNLGELQSIVQSEMQAGRQCPFLHKE